MDKIQKKRIAEIDLLKAFYEKAVNTSDFFSLAEELEQLCKKGFINALVKFELSLLQQEKFYLPNPANLKNWVIFDDGNMTLSIIHRKIDLKNSVIASNSPSDNILCSLTENVPFKLYKKDKVDTAFILNELEPLNTDYTHINLGKYESVKIKKELEVISFEEVDHDVLFLILSKKKYSEFVIEYNLDTLQPIRLVSQDQKSTRIEFTCNSLAELDAKESLPNLIKLLKSKDHNIRWSAVKSITYIDAEEGFKCLETLLDDPHPEVQDLARKSIESLREVLI